MGYEEPQPPLDGGEGDWEDVAPPGAEPAEADDGEADDDEFDDAEFDDFADLYYGE